MKIKLLLANLLAKLSFSGAVGRRFNLEKARFLYRMHSFYCNVVTINKGLPVLLIGSLCVLTVSCGFHLRGHVSIPPELKILFLQSNTPYAPFEQTMRARLHSYNIKLTNTATAAPLTLTILNTNWQQTPGAFSTNLTTRQYTLSLTVTYQVLASDGMVVVPTNSVTATTAFTIDSSQLLSSTDLGQQYHDNMQEDAASRLMSQLVSKNSRRAIDEYFARANIQVARTNAT